jgi:hypothetical protein
MAPQPLETTQNGLGKWPRAPFMPYPTGRPQNRASRTMPLSTTSFVSSASKSGSAHAAERGAEQAGAGRRLRSPPPLRRPSCDRWRAGDAPWPSSGARPDPLPRALGKGLTTAGTVLASRGQTRLVRRSPGPLHQTGGKNTRARTSMLCLGGASGVSGFSNEV